MGSGAALSDGELVALLRLGLLPGVGDRTVGALVERFGSAEAAWAAPGRALAEVAGRAAVEARSGGEIARAAARALDRARDEGIRVLSWNDPAYPAVLGHLYDPPPVLFLRGRFELLGHPCVAVVGSRKATVSGRRTAEVIGRALAEAGVPVASGLAMGIDGAAHRGALEGGGDCVGVLGSGVDVAYPRANRDLFRRLGGDHLLVSEFLPGTTAAPHHFPRRNRILAALSSAVIVVEAAERSGALITVDHALDLGREILAVPGPVDRKTSCGTNTLIRDGATMICDPWQVVELLDAARLPARSSNVAAGSPWTSSDSTPASSDRRDAPTPGLDDLDPDLRSIAGALREGARTAEELSRELGIGAGRVLAGLSELEAAGWARLLPGARYGHARPGPEGEGATAGSGGGPGRERAGT